MNLKTGDTNVIRRGTNWFNHLQFSPTDPTLLQFCHEGPWHKLDRIWHIRTDGSGLADVSALMTFLCKTPITQTKPASHLKAGVSPR